MSRSVARAAVAAAAALLCATLGAVPAAGAESEQSAQSAPTAPMRTAMARDLGVPPEQVEQQLATEQAAARTWHRLRDELGTAYAGAWLDPGGALVVATADPAGAPVIAEADARPVVTARSAGELEEVQAQLDAAASAAGGEVGSWYVDPRSNAVVVATTDRAAGEAFVAAADATTEPIRIEVVAERPRLFADLVGGQAILAAAGGRCSIGFSARSGAAAFVLTAGHCTEVGGDWAGADGVRIGPVAATDFPGDDFGAISVANTAAWTPTATVAGSTPVAGATAAPIGASVCRSGSTTGFRCGTVLAGNATVNYGGGDVVRGLTRTDACAEPGDSGGSVVSGNQAQGLTSGGSGNCRTGGVTFFQPIDEVLDSYGLTLVTG